MPMPMLATVHVSLCRAVKRYDPVWTTAACTPCANAWAFSTPDPMTDGLSRDQRFFANWATVWRRNFSPEELKVRLTTDSHAPANFRAIGAPSNMPAFAAAFGCKAGDPMVRGGDQQVVIW